MKFCPNCGQGNPDDAVFCLNCAFRFDSAPPPGQPGYQPLPPQPYYPPPGQPPYPPPGYQYYEAGYPKYAGFWIRFGAYLIDGIILWIARWPVYIIFFLINDNFTWWGGWRRGTAIEGTTSWILYILFIAITVGIWFGYFIIMTGRYGATLGKMLLKLKVVREDMGKVSYGTAALRETVGKFISAIVCYIGFIWAGFDSRKQAWHDKIAHTFVIITGP